MDPASLVCAAIATVFGLIFALKRHLERLKPFEGLPMPEPCNWIHGHALMMGTGDFREAIHRLTVEFANAHGLCGHWLGNLPVLTVANYKDARQILMTEYSRRGMGILDRHMEGAIGPRNFLVANGREWKMKRDVITRTFDHDFMLESRKTMKETTLSMVETLKSKLNSGLGNEMDIQPIMKMLTLQVFGLMAFNVDLKCCENLAPSELASSFDFLIQEFGRRMADPINPFNFFYGIPAPCNLRHKKEKAAIYSFVTGLIEERRGGQATDNGVLSRLMKIEATLEKSIDGTSPLDLLDDVMVLLFAGYDTTSITLTYCANLLSLHPKVQQLCVDEVNKVDDLQDPKELLYCKAVIQETLRLFPPAPQTSRTLERAKTLQGGFVAPKGSIMFVSIWSMQRDAEVFPKPLEFRPDRWVQKTKTQWLERESSEDVTVELEPGCTIAAANRKAFFPFSAGGRSCAGQQFALDEAVLVLANLVKHIQFLPAAVDHKPEIEIRGILQMPKNGVPLILKERQ